MLCQAEDGIRDLVRSRGLGDVYKRQERARFADVPIEVLSGAEFTARTGSLERGPAAVLIRDGTPVVVLRDGKSETLAVTLGRREEAEATPTPAASKPAAHLGPRTQCAA